MKLQQLNCPACGAPVGENLKPGYQFDCPACGSALILTDLAKDDQSICPRCKRVNDISKQYCEECGELLKTPCPFCYAQNKTDAEHCRQCGVNLQRARQRKQSWVDEQRRHEVDRLAALKEAEARSRQARLHQLLEDLDEPENHPMAIYCLNEYGSEAIESLIPLLKDDDPDARYGAAQALGKFGDRRAIGPLVEALGDEEPAVRYWAADALGRLRAESAVDAIASLLNDKHKGIREHAEDVLTQIGGPKVQHILQQQKSKGWWPF